MYNNRKITGLCVEVFQKPGARPEDAIEDALRRLKRDINAEGILTELKKREYYVKPSTVRREKKKENIRRLKLKERRK